MARRLGVTQPLLYRYFPSKDDLIKEVYRTVYLEPLDMGWEALLADRSRLRDRLLEVLSRVHERAFHAKVDQHPSTMRRTRFWLVTIGSLDETMPAPCAGVPM